MPPLASRRQRASRGGGMVDLTKEEPDFDCNSGIDPNTPAMPQTRKRSAANALDTTGSHASKRRRTSGDSPSTSRRPYKPRRKEPWRDVSSPFSHDELFSPTGRESQESIDLSNATEVPKELLAPTIDNRVKLGRFQCVICMDDVAALTVTHCGHLFCSECLHSSLHIDSMKKTCPVCRTKVDLRDKKGKNQKSFYHLELKVMTAIKKGKRPAGQP
ncbi:hypothetical protein F4779DRAFT_608571 [Xylariaceae sp. FL0662B]|nr:hypothetical protein F4779DRAFT_608571 [Xylariaceae sp. FL0662B]